MAFSPTGAWGIKKVSLILLIIFIKKVTALPHTTCFLMYNLINEIDTKVKQESCIDWIKKGY